LTSIVTGNAGIHSFYHKMAVRNNTMKCKEQQDARVLPPLCSAPWCFVPFIMFCA